MILSITVKEIMFWNGNFIYVIRNVSFTFDFKKLLENALRFVTDSWIFCHAQPISLAWTDPRFWKCNANFTNEKKKLYFILLSINLRVFE